MDYTVKIENFEGPLDLLLYFIQRDKKIGKPLLYGTSQKSLEAFEINDLNDLPSIKEMEEITNMNNINNEIK